MVKSNLYTHAENPVKVRKSTLQIAIALGDGYLECDAILRRRYFISLVLRAHFEDPKSKHHHLQPQDSKTNTAPT